MRFSDTKIKQMSERDNVTYCLGKWDQRDTAAREASASGYI